MLKSAYGKYTHTHTQYKKTCPLGYSILYMIQPFNKWDHSSSSCNVLHANHANLKTRTAQEKKS